MTQKYQFHNLQILKTTRILIKKRTVIIYNNKKILLFNITNNKRISDKFIKTYKIIQTGEPSKTVKLLQGGAISTKLLVDTCHSRF